MSMNIVTGDGRTFWLLQRWISL